MHIFSRDILGKIQCGESGLEQMVPDKVAAIIKERQLFGCKNLAIAEPPSGR
jgi:hypothetical protein